jgi:hypothetical protein
VDMGSKNLQRHRDCQSLDSMSNPENQRIAFQRDEIFQVELAGKQNRGRLRSAIRSLLWPLLKISNFTERVDYLGRVSPPKGSGLDWTN